MIKTPNTNISSFKNCTKNTNKMDTLKPTTIPSITSTTSSTIAVNTEKLSERRLSTTSESSVEPMDLGRTPTPPPPSLKKLLKSRLNENIKDELITTTPIKLNSQNDSEETYESEDHDESNNLDKIHNKKAHKLRNHLNSLNNHNRHHRTIVQIEASDNPHSLRKKFRISTPNRSNSLSNINNNNNLPTLKCEGDGNEEDDKIPTTTTTTDLKINSLNPICEEDNKNNSSVSRRGSHEQDNNSDGSTADTVNHNSGDEDRTNNESGFVDSSGHNLMNLTSLSSPESGVERNSNDDVKYVCPICEVVSATPHEFTNHIRSHNYSSGDSENFTCRICSKVLSSASSLDRHVLVHTGERPFNCKYCHLTFTTNGNMHRHMRTHKQHQQHTRRSSSNVNSSNNSTTMVGNGITKNNKDNICKTTNITNINLINNLNSNGNNNNGTGNITNLNMNGGLDGGESYESEDGCSTDSSASNNSSNQKSNSNNNNNNINNNLNNNYKRKSIDDDSGILKKRMKTINNNNIINENDPTEFIISTTNPHNQIIQQPQMQQQHQKFCCPVCNRNDFISMPALGTHMDREHSDIPAKCRQCDVVFKTHKQLNAHRCTKQLNIMQGFKDLTFVDFTSDKFPLIAKSLCEQNIRTSITNPKYECPKCYIAFPCINSLDIHIKDCNEKRLSCLIEPTQVMITNSTAMMMSTPSSILPKDFSMRKTFNMQQQLIQQHHQPTNLTQLPRQLKRTVSSESYSDEDDQNNNHNNNNDDQNNNNDNSDEAQDDVRHRDAFFAHLDLKNKSAMSLATSSLMSSPRTSEKSDNIKLELEKQPTATRLNQLNNNNRSDNQMREQQFQQQLQHQQNNDSKDLADIQSILNVTSSSSNFLRNFENSVNTPSSECGYGKDEEEAQDSFTAEFRKMKLRGEFPCKLCTAVFPNLRALKGHNRIHISAAGAAGPFRCNMCLYSIHDKAALVRHMRTHNGDRPYECAVCNYAFTTKANCERHLRNRHAKTTREDVKRAIIYHPSEDSSCDDPTKKLHLFSSPEFDNDEELNVNPKDRSTPVSHLKEILQSDSKPVKIQVKSLEKLIDKTTTNNNFNVPSYQSNHDDEKDYDDSIESQSESGRPIDLSMDVLDLSKKPAKPFNDDDIPSKQKELTPEPLKMDLSQQLLLAQQQFFAETLPKMDPANYFQLCRNLPLPMPFHPFFFQNPLLSNNLGDFSKFAPLINSAALFGNPATSMPSVSSTTNTNPINNQILNNQNQHEQQLSGEKSQIESPLKNIINSTSNSQLLPKTLPNTSGLSMSNTLNIPTQQSLPQSQQLPAQPQQQHLPSHQQQHQPSQLVQQSPQNSGPVKMVIKNGVLMPKQKQRRYRTERPFACEHCSARFTLRSNMERHIKQQHPQFWAQRQRSGQHVMRGRGSSSNVMSHMQTSHMRLPNSLPNNMQSSHYGAISDQVKYAILAQQLKVKKDTTDILQQALTQGSNNSPFNSNALNSMHNNGSMEDDDPKLIIDEDDDIDDDEEEQEDDDDDDDNENCHDDEDDFKPEDLTQSSDPNKNVAGNILGAKKVAETILEQAIKAGSSIANKNLLLPKDDGLKIAHKMIARAESVGKNLIDVASSPFKDESPDLVSVSKLVDNATNNAMSFNNYFRPNDVETTINNVNQMEQSDEEGLVASGSASDNNSGAEEICINAGQQKKKSAYSLAPNRVPCPYCDRIFPWSSSLRRHILTHTGQKPFKCSHCPLLFTTKSNCDRHLLRKHGNVESAVSLYVPIEDIPDPIPIPKAVAEAVVAAKAAAAASAAANNAVNTVGGIGITNIEDSDGLKLNSSSSNMNQANQKSEQTLALSSTDLPFKCHLCDSSFSERMQCLDHIKVNHVQEFALLLSKGAIDTEADMNSHIHHSTEEEDKRDDGRGKYPDYANRKVICAFCVRRFWSTEDLRRHMRTHSGERPFQCEICLRKFTLKHSMLRHMKKHNGGNHNIQSTNQNSGSDCSDDEQPSASMILSNSLRNHKIHELLTKVSTGLNNDWHNRLTNRDPKDNNIAFQSFIKAEQLNGGGGGNDDNEGNSGIILNPNTDLIGNLLGISDQGLLNKFLTNPGEAAKFFGVEK